MIGVFGGTFNPVHFGHLRTAVEFRYFAACRKVLMIPAARPPLRIEPDVAPQLRAEMLSLALADLEHIEPDNRELRREGPSYTVDTLRELAVEYPGETLCLLLGSDAFSRFTDWHQWDHILRLCHLAVAVRPGFPVTVSRDHAELGSRFRDDPSGLQEDTCGNILLLHMTQLEISASRIRDLLRTGIGAEFLVPQGVLQFIREHNLYHDR